MLDFELLRAFVAVADCGGFHRAAERLNLTQSTVSQQIKRLERETKRPLFRRTTRSVALTDDGDSCSATRVACCNLRKLLVSA
jgi:DNA-binding transcriptional LysR family regulator